MNLFSKLESRNPKLKILLVMSSPEELRPFLHTVRCRQTSWYGCKAWNFQDPDFTGLALLAGMGGTAPPALTSRAIAAFRPDVIIVAGFGGALTPLPPPTGVHIASECRQFFPSGNQLLRINFSPPAPLATLASLLAAQGLPVTTGVSVTTPVVTLKASLPGEVFRLPQPVLDLETAGIASVAENHHLPCLAVRTITDGADEEIQEFLAGIINRHQGVPLSRLLPALWTDPRRVTYCLHLWRRSRQAGRNLARALTTIISYLTRHRV